MNTNKQVILNAIWNDPQKVFGCPFRESGKYKANEVGGEYKEKGKIRLLQTSMGNIIVFYNGSSRTEQTGVLDYLENYVLHTAGYGETLKRLSDIYGISLQYSEEYKRRMKREELAREIGPILYDSLRNNPTGTAGTYITQQRKLRIDKHFGELTKESLKKVKDHLHNRGIIYQESDLKALQLTKYNANNGYNVVLPYYHKGYIKGFILRNVNNNSVRYLYSEELGRLGYCDKLKSGEHTIIVEGQFDAIRLMQTYSDESNRPNIIAMGGAAISQDIAELLCNNNNRAITYIPDVEYDDNEKRKTSIRDKAIQSFLSATVEGKKVFESLYIVDLSPSINGNLQNYKIDVDDYGRQYSNEILLNEINNNRIRWYQSEFHFLEEWAKTSTVWNTTDLFRDRFSAIYKQCNPYERESIKRYIKDKELYIGHDVTPYALDDIDEWDRTREYNDRIKAISTELTKAIDNGVNPVVVAKISEQLRDAQATNSRDEWDKSINRTFNERLNSLKQQSISLSTKWQLGVVKKSASSFIPTETIEFTPEDITVFCAPTSHGKTMILFQSALDMVQKYSGKTFLYVSCEESEKQLFERALNVYIPIKNTPDGKDNNKYCFRRRYRRKTIVAALSNDLPPCNDMQNKEYNDIQSQIKQHVEDYGNTIDNRLKLIHTGTSTDNICSNITRFVRESVERGVEVGAVFVDYMQLLSDDTKHYSRHDELKSICKSLSNCAKTNSIPIIIAAQLNRDSYKEGIDNISVANIGEGADIERIAKDIFLVWQVDKTSINLYKKKANEKEDEDDDVITKAQNLGKRAQRIFIKDKDSYQEDVYRLKSGYIYIEHLKARYGQTGGWGLLPYDGESGQIGVNDIKQMEK